MKTILTISGILISSIAFGQNCTCDTDSVLKEIISCDTIKFDNHANLFWSFNCDSSWLTFESPAKHKTILFSLGDGLQNLTGRLGYVSFFEYGNTFLVRNNVISGCCTPPDYYLYNKGTGHLKGNLGPLVFYGEGKDQPFAVGLSSKGDTSSSAACNYLAIYNLNNDEIFFLDLPKGQIIKALQETEKLYAEFLFDEPEVTGNTVILRYHVMNPKEEVENSVKTITIDLTKYTR